MGKWLEKYGYSIYGTRGGPFRPADWGVSTRKGNKVFLHILKWSGNSPEISIPDIGIAIKGVKIAGGGKASVNKTSTGYSVKFDGKLLQPLNTIVEIDYEADVMKIKPFDVASQSLSFSKNVTGSSNLKAQWINHQWTDIKSVTNGDWSGSFWQPADDDKAPWVEIDLGKPERFSKVVIYESVRNIKSFELQYKEGETWKTFHKGTTVGERAEISTKPVETQFVRMVINSFSSVPQIYEIMILE
jgi:alpha-L-fucosidase